MNVMYATWVVRRPKVTQGNLQSGSVNGYITVGTWIGDYQSSHTVLQQFPGAPVVTADVVAFLPGDCASLIQVGDVFFFAEKSIAYTAQGINDYAEKVMVLLKTMATQSGS